MMLEVGIIPVTFNIMQKNILFLQYILKQNLDAMIRKVLHFENRKQKREFLNLIENL